MAIDSKQPQSVNAARGRFKAVIVGGSVTGLVLANILEKLGIDFVVLEGYSEIAPQVGASIGVWGGGMRVLDQVGCSDKLLELVEHPVNWFSIWIDSKKVMDVEGSGTHFLNRWGYPAAFIDRQQLLQVMYDNLQQKEKILLNKKAVKIAMTKTGVRVDTADGASFTGDIVVGADGIHSFARNEMKRLASDVSPKYFPVDEDKKVACNVQLLFGIAPPFKSLRAGKVTIVMLRGRAFLLVGGTGKLFWFLFETLPKTLYLADDVPKFTKQDETALVEKYKDDVVSDALTFADVYAQTYISNMTLLHEHVFKKWHYQRIITIGDSAHKFHPNAGHGGNNCMESAAALANAITRRIDTSSTTTSPLSDEAITAAFTEVQSERVERVTEIMEACTKQHTVETLNELATRILLPLLFPLAKTEGRFDRSAVAFCPATSVEALPIPKRPRYMPYWDELPAKPLRTWAWWYLPRLLVLSAFGGLYYLSTIAFKGPSGLPETFLGEPFRTHFTGVKGVDAMLTILVKVFTPAVTRSHPEAHLQILYFLPMLIPVILIWTAEAYRRGNTHSMSGRLVTLPSLFAAAYQLRGIGQIAPLYFLLSTLTSSTRTYTRTTGRALPASAAKALLPGILVGYALPTALMALPFESRPAWQDAIALWQFAPVLAGLCTWVLTRVFARLADEAADKQDCAFYANPDVPHLQSAYAFGFAASALVHLATAAYIAGSKSLSVARVFGVEATWAPGYNAGGALSVADQIFMFLKWDLVLFVAATTVYCLYSVWEMRRLGYVTGAQAARAAVGVLGGLVALGPGAMYAGTWYWREGVIVGLSK